MNLRSQAALIKEGITQETHSIQLIKAFQLLQREYSESLDCIIRIANDIKRKYNQKINISELFQKRLRHKQLSNIWKSISTQQIKRKTKTINHLIRAFTIINCSSEKIKYVNEQMQSLLQLFQDTILKQLTTISTIKYIRYNLEKLLIIRQQQKLKLFQNEQWLQQNLSEIFIKNLNNSSSNKMALKHLKQLETIESMQDISEMMKQNKKVKIEESAIQQQSTMDQQISNSLYQNQHQILPIYPFYCLSQITYQIQLPNCHSYCIPTPPFFPIPTFHQ